MNETGAKSQITISSVFGRLQELQELLSKLHAETELTFTGDYADIGPFPLETIDFLIRLKRSNPHISFGRSDHDSYFLLACGLIQPEPHLNVAWLNPYHGTFRVIAEYGMNPCELLAERGKSYEVLLEKVERRGHLDFWKTIAIASQATERDRAPYDGVIARDDRSRETWTVSNHEDHFGSYVQWVNSRISSFVYEVRL